MSVRYVGVQWNRQKRNYDIALGLGIVGFLICFVVVARWARPYITVETLLIRSTAVCAWILLHMILSVGPLARLDPQWLPMLYNRRHLGVFFFLVCSLHAGISLMQLHGFGDISPLLSLLTSNGRFGSVPQFPFQLLGLAAWCIFLLMAATSHDFWLANLSPPLWKALHMAAYLAYALVTMHVALGAGQSQGWGVAVLSAVGVVWLVTLHALAAQREARLDASVDPADGWVLVPRARALDSGRARVVRAGGERVAVFRDGEEFHALSNVCQHQNGPLGEGRILDGCVTCPWHGFQYAASTGRAPAPFEDRVPTFDTCWRGDELYVRTTPRCFSADPGMEEVRA